MSADFDLAISPAANESILESISQIEPAAASGIAAADQPEHLGYIIWPEMRGKFQLTEYDLKETRRRSQWLVMNTYARVLRRLARYLGTPKIKANTRDREWNEAADTFWAETYVDKVGNYDASGKFTSETFLTTTVFQAWRDSDCTGIHLTKPNGEPTCAAIEANRIDNDWRFNPQDKWQDGVLTDWSDRHIAYSIATNPPGRSGNWAQTEYQIVGAGHCHMFGDFESQSSVRGTPALIHCVNDLLSDRQISEANLELIKIAKQYAVVFTSQLGAGNGPSLPYAPAGPRRRDATNPSGTATTTGNSTAPGATATTHNATGQRVVAEVVGGAEVHRLPAGVDAKTLQPANHMPEQQALREDIYTKVALGLGVPVELLFLLDKLTGPGIRFVLRQSQEWRNYWLKTMQTWMSADWARRIEWAVRTGRLPKCKDPEFARHYFQMPRAITIDDGRSASAMIAALEAGVTNLHELWGEKGCDWREETTARIEEIKHALDECERQGVPPEYYFTKVRPDLAEVEAAEEEQSGLRDKPAQKPKPDKSKD